MRDFDLHSFEDTTDESEDFDRWDLGDALGDDDQLRAVLSHIERQYNQDRSSRAFLKTLDLIELVFNGAGLLTKVTSKSYQWIRDRLLGGNVQDAKAEKLKAEATLIEAQAEATSIQVAANTKTERQSAIADNNLKSAELARKLDELGIDYEARTDREGRLKIVVTKDKR